MEGKRVHGRHAIKWKKSVQRFNRLEEFCKGVDIQVLDKVGSSYRKMDHRSRMRMM
uniref:AlNc14C103G6101 protein n=1 Tax=Albugo laibachii Nc14 TaxID=890382 RepID=F0WHP4_9STRA|nr:AlNc14C103G6101 [Albugo laibachii Nc14]CCA23725.1 AlNc14C204G8775 [Albugo laibachii Nc14]|eukprot:CCA23725.1 AlNc14C204G8775 [Albugo laibachii Nc14]